MFVGSMSTFKTIVDYDCYCNAIFFFKFILYCLLLVYLTGIRLIEYHIQ